MRYHVFQQRTLRGKRWFWHLKAANHEIIAQGDSSGYHNAIDAQHAIELVKGTGPATETRIMAPLPPIFRRRRLA